MKKCCNLLFILFCFMFVSCDYSVLDFDVFPKEWREGDFSIICYEPETLDYAGMTFPLSFFSNRPGTDVYYTQDGSDPTEDSKKLPGQYYKDNSPFLTKQNHNRIYFHSFHQFEGEINYMAVAQGIDTPYFGTLAMEVPELWIDMSKDKESDSYKLKSGRFLQCEAYWQDATSGDGSDDIYYTNVTFLEAGELLITVNSGRFDADGRLYYSTDNITYERIYEETTLAVEPGGRLRFKFSQGNKYGSRDHLQLSM